ncbi:EpsG family protein [Clostridium perfringens]|uniref:EpsG family protein n=1 Tax=Clostridium perfringens TaxID=1502 RepID=UPI003F43DEF0
MYIIQRLIGVSIYSIVLLIVCNLLAITSKKDHGKILFFYNVLLFIMAYNFIPVPGNDLFRLFDTLHFYGSKNIKEIIDVMTSTATPTNALYFYLIGKFNNESLLPAITSAIFFRNIFYIIKDYSTRNNIKSNNVSIALFFFMSTGVYFEVISGIRTMLGFSIVAVCMYNEYIKKKSLTRNIIWYLLAGFLHPAVLAIILIRILYLLRQNSNNKIRNILIVLLVLIFGIIYGDKFINAMIEKAFEYTTSKNKFSYLGEYIVGAIKITIIFIIQYLNRKSNRRKDIDSGIIDLINIINIISVLVIGVSFFEYNTFYRFLIFNSIIFIPVLMSSLNLNLAKIKNIARLKRIVITLSILMLIIECTRGNLCSLKFFI